MRTTRLIPRVNMSFVCQKCGACCSSMGEIIEIREPEQKTTFRIWFTTTGEERVVTLDPDKEDLFFNTPAKSRMACPFLREKHPGTVICTVHSSRPDLCRQYGCFRILVLDSEGRRVGRVMNNSRFFTTENPRLHEIWQRECQGLSGQDEQRWEEEIERILSREGYQIIR